MHIHIHTAIAVALASYYCFFTGVFSVGAVFVSVASEGMFSLLFRCLSVLCSSLCGDLSRTTSHRSLFFCLRCRSLSLSLFLVAFVNYVVVLTVVAVSLCRSPSAFSPSLLLIAVVTFGYKVFSAAEYARYHRWLSSLCVQRPCRPPFSTLYPLCGFGLTLLR